MSGYPSFLRRIEVTNNSKYDDMFHQGGLMIGGLWAEETALSKMLVDFRAKHEAISLEFEAIVKASEKLLESYRVMGTTFELPYAKEMCDGWARFVEVLQLTQMGIKEVGAELQHPAIDFVKLHGAQTPMLLKFMERNQGLKNELIEVRDKIRLEKMDCKATVVEDIERLRGYLNHITHHQFKSFFLLKSRDMLVRIGRELEPQSCRLEEVSSGDNEED